MRSPSVLLLSVATAVCALICVSSPMYACHLHPPGEIALRAGVTGGQEFSGTVPLVAEVKNCETKGDMVVFLVNGTIVAVDRSVDETGRYTAQWDTTKTKDGEITLRASAVLADDKVLNSEPLKVVVTNISSEEGN